MTAYAWVLTVLVLMCLVWMGCMAYLLDKEQKAHEETKKKLADRPEYETGVDYGMLYLPFYEEPINLNDPDQRRQWWAANPKDE